MLSTNFVCAVFCIFFLSVLLVEPARAQDPVPESETAFYAPSLDSSGNHPALMRLHDVPLHNVVLPPSPRRPAWHDMITNIPGDWASSAGIVVRGSSLPYIAGIAAVTGSLILTDHFTYRASRGLYERSSIVRNSSDFLVRMGDGKTHLGLAAAFALYGFLADDSRALTTASQTVESLLACGIAVQVLKRIAGRESPEAAKTGQAVWHCFPSPGAYQKHQTRYYAFPSGHIATTMATVTVLAENFPEQTWIRPVGYALVGCVGISLVNVKYHWYSDLPLGMALGYTFGMIAAHRNNGLLASKEEGQGATVRIYPALLSQGAGVGLAVLF